MGLGRGRAHGTRTDLAHRKGHKFGRSVESIVLRGCLD